jgi:transcriptional regulator with XRE-family HTH domain
MKENKSHPLDIHIGQQLRLRRKMMGMSQALLGKGIGMTFQQIQKYERGFNSINARRLHEFAVILDVPLMYFYEGYAEGIDLAEPKIISTQGQHLMQDFECIPSAKVKRCIAALVREVAKGGDDGL